MWLKIEDGGLDDRLDLDAAIERWRETRLSSAGVRRGPIDDMEQRQPDQDLRDALEYNPGIFEVDRITNVHATVAGANDEFDWYWVVYREEDDDYWLIDAACDSTGWDCQSWVHIHGPYGSALEAARHAAPVQEEESGRKIQACLLAQLRGETPYGLYEAEEHHKS